jgi:hypothetical protein
MSVIAYTVEGVHGKHEKPKPITATWEFKAVGFGVGGAITLGATVGGGAIAVTSYHHPLTSPSSAYGVATGDRSDPNHVDTSGEFIRVETAQYGGTAAVFHNQTVVPGGIIAGPSTGSQSGDAQDNVPGSGCTSDLSVTGTCSSVRRLALVMHGT